MYLSITKVGKAKNELKKLGITNFKENSSNYSFEFGEEDAGEIIQNGYSHRLATLVKVGEYLKTSLLTRSTSHKDNDFASIQANSSLNVQKLYKKILNNTPDAVFTSRQVTLDKQDEKTIKTYEKRLNESLSKIQKIINTNKPIGDFVKKQLHDNAVTQSTLNKLDGLIPNNVQFIKQNSVSAAKNYLPEKAGTTIKDSMVQGFTDLGFVSVPICVSFAESLLAKDALALGMIVSNAQFMAVAGPVILALPLAIAAGLLIAALVVNCDKERFGTIILKRRIIQINDEFTKALKHLNAASKILKKYNSEPKEKIDSTLSDEQMEILQQFFEEQKELWNLYATTEGKGYHRTTDEAEDGVHKVGLIKVKDETIEKRTIQILKLIVARLWTNVQLNI